MPNNEQAKDRNPESEKKSSDADEVKSPGPIVAGFKIGPDAKLSYSPEKESTYPPGSVPHERLESYYNNTSRGPQYQQQPPPRGCSTEIKNLAIALAKAQSEIQHASKDQNNPHFNKPYADLASVWDACRAALTKNGLSIVQLPETNRGEMAITTLVLHASGEWIENRLVMPVASPGGAHQIGSAITYARRYALAALVGVAPDDDDDGNAAQPSKETKSAPPKGGPPKAAKAPSSPPAQAPAAPPKVLDTDPATSNDLKTLFALAKKNAWKTEDALKEAMKMLFNKAAFKELTHGECDDFTAICAKYKPEDFMAALEEGHIAKGPEGRWTP